MSTAANRPLTLGLCAETRREFRQSDIDELHALTGAPRSQDHVPGALINGLFSYLLGVELPGQGTNYLKQETEFLRPAKLGECLTARVEITRLRPDKHLVDLATTCRNPQGELIARGRALVLARDVAGAFG